MGWEGYKFMKKLKFLKEKFKVWNREIFGDIRIRKRENLQEFEHLDRRESEDGLTEDQATHRFDFSNELDELFYKEETSW